MADWLYIGSIISGVIGTLSLGIIAWLNIRQARNIHKAERRERLLNEIIEWATDIIRVSWGFGQAFKEAIKPATEKEQQLFKYAHVAEVKERFMQFAGRNVYITTVASTFAKSAKRLQEEIKVLDKDLVAYILFLDNWQRELQSNITNDKSDKEENSEKADEYVRSINKSANKVIEEATKIKARDIGGKEENMPKESEATVSNEPTLKDIEKHLTKIEGHVIQIRKNVKAQGIGGFGFTGMAAGMALVVTGVQTTSGLVIFIVGFIATLYSFYLM